MKVLAAYLLAVLGGKATPTKDDVKSIISAVKGTVTDEQLDSVFAKFEEKKDVSLEDLMAAGAKRMASLPAAGAAPAAAASAAAAPAEEKKEEEKEEEEEVIGTGGLFGGDSSSDDDSDSD